MKDIEIVKKLIDGLKKPKYYAIAICVCGVVYIVTSCQVQLQRQSANCLQESNTSPAVNLDSVSTVIK